MEPILRVEHLTHTYGERDALCTQCRAGCVPSRWRPGSFWASSATPVQRQVHPDPASQRPAAAHQRPIFYLDGKDIWAEPKKIREVRFQVGLVFQYPEYQLFEETVYKDIAFGPTNMGLAPEEVDRRGPGGGGLCRPGRGAAGQVAL